MSGVGGDSTTLSAESRPKAPDSLVAWTAAGTFVVFVLLAEGSARLAARTGFWYARVDLAGTVTSRPELVERVQWAASRSRPLFVLGDSVLGASALLEHGAPEARRSALAEVFADRERPGGVHVESLAADGILLPDVEAESGILEETGTRGGSLLVLNVRMFAAEFQGEPHEASRPFLARAKTGSAAASPSEWLTARSALFRTTAMLQPLWYFPTRRDFFRRAAERMLGNDEDPDVQEAALRLKVAPYYRGRWSATSTAFRALGQAIERLRARGPVFVVLTPQNAGFVEDPDAFAANRALLARYVRERADSGAGAGIAYRDWADRYPPERFLDHCHLTAEGNRAYAFDLAAWLRS